MITIVLTTVIKYTRNLPDITACAYKKNIYLNSIFSTLPKY